METPIENIRLSQLAKEQLIRLKRTTGITQWNILCRWAFCLSLSDPTPPKGLLPPADSSVEMTWRTFGGEHSELYAALLRQQCIASGSKNANGDLALEFRRHLYRGISLLTGSQSMNNVSGMLGTAVASNE